MENIIIISSLCGLNGSSGSSIRGEKKWRRKMLETFKTTLAGFPFCISFVNNPVGDERDRSWTVLCERWWWRWKSKVLFFLPSSSFSMKSTWRYIFLFVIKSSTGLLCSQRQWWYNCHRGAFCWKRAQWLITVNLFSTISVMCRLESGDRHRLILALHIHFSTSSTNHEFLICSKTDERNQANQL